VAVFIVAIVVVLGASAAMGHGSGRKRSDKEVAQLLGRFDSINIPRGDARPLEVWITKSGEKPVLLLHEVNGLTPETLELALRLEQANFRVYMPLLFGRAGHSLNGFRTLLMLVHPASNPFARDEVSPRIELARMTLDAIATRSGARPISVIGMCLTGNFGIPLVADPRVGRAAVPFGLTASRRSALGVSQADIDAARGSGKPMMALRFSSDTKCPVERWERLRTEFGRDGQIRLYPPIETGTKPWMIPKNAHAVLTRWYQPEKPDDYPTHVAFRKVVDFLNGQR
jgi:dienelactone hydrolase